MSSGPEIKVVGLVELNRAFRQVDSDVPKRLRVALLKVATDVANAAADKVPKVTGKAAASIKPRATQKGAGLAFGGQAAPYYPWLDFGGSVGRHKSIHRPFLKKGRYVYPTIEEKGPEIIQAVSQAIDEAAKEAGF